jgi:glycosyltransferase involved in cell wall biosynthesis
MFTIIISAYERYSNIELLIHSLKCQTYSDFEAIIVHDGYNETHEKIVKPYLSDTRFKYTWTDKRYNNWGMASRNVGLELVNNEWVINTSDDNYYVPIFLEELYKTQKDNPYCNFMYYDCILSHHNILNHNRKDYGLLIPQIKHSHIDLGQFAVKNEVIKKYRFQSVAPADGVMIEEFKHELKPVYIDKVLFVHN